MGVTRFKEVSTIVANTSTTLFSWTIKDFESFSWSKGSFLSSQPIEIEEIDRKVFFRIIGETSPTGATFFTIEFAVHDDSRSKQFDGNFSFQVSLNGQQCFVDESNSARHKHKFSTYALHLYEVYCDTLELNFEITCESFRNKLEKISRETQLANAKSECKIERAIESNDFEIVEDSEDKKYSTIRWDNKSEASLSDENFKRLEESSQWKKLKQNLLQFQEIVPMILMNTLARPGDMSVCIC